MSQKEGENVEQFIQRLKQQAETCEFGDRLNQQIIDQVNEKRKEGNGLFNDALNTFYFTVIWCRTYGKGPLR